MNAISPSEEVFICQTCGDEGFTNAHVYCVKCLQFVIHRYCLNVIPETFDELVIWYCEQCKPAVQDQVTSPKVDSSPSEKNEVKENIDLKWSEPSSSDLDSSSSSSNQIGFDKWEAGIVQQNQSFNRLMDDFVMTCPVYCQGDNPPRERKRSHDGEQTQSSHHKKKKKKDNKESDIASLIVETKELLSHSLPKESSTNMEKIADNDYQVPNYENNTQDKYYKRAEPIIDPVWRGSFSVDGKGVFEGFVGHLSSEAHHAKVHEEANMLPSLLHLQRHPTTLLWPDSFQVTEPTDGDIAIYFFPGDPINERAFDKLVGEMMDGELAMRATDTNADLLIFTSAALPPLFWRYKDKFYLWGVFRPKRDAPTSIAGADMDPESED